MEKCINLHIQCQPGCQLCPPILRPITWLVSYPLLVQKGPTWRDQRPACSAPLSIMKRLSEYSWCGSWIPVMSVFSAKQICRVFKSNCHWVLMIPTPAVLKWGGRKPLRISQDKLVLNKSSKNNPIKM